MPFSRYDFTSAPIENARFEPLPDPRKPDPTTSRGSGLLIAAAILIVIVGMAFCGAQS